MLIIKNIFEKKNIRLISDESSYLDNSNLDNSCQGSTSMDTSNPDSLYSVNNQANFSFFRNIDSSTSQGKMINMTHFTSKRIGNKIRKKFWHQKNDIL